jgi:hypothetical protein
MLTQTDMQLFAALEGMRRQVDQIEILLHRNRSERTAQADELSELRMMASSRHDGLPLQDVDLEDDNNAIESIQRPLDSRQTKQR